MNIGFIGIGNMGSALIKGITDSENTEKNINVFDVDKQKYKSIEKFKINIKENVIQLVNESDVIVIAVKPNIVKIVLDEIKNYIDKKKIVVSIAVGVPIKIFENTLGSDKKIVRTMPNTPALVGEGVTIVSFNDNIYRDEKESIIKIFESVGIVEELNENLMCEVTALTGSSPAYIYMLIEAMADGGVLSGLPRDISYKLAAQSVLGSAKMVLETKLHPGVLKDQVCSPAGTTIEAVYKLEKNGFRHAVIDAMDSCTKKAILINEKFK